MLWSGDTKQKKQHLFAKMKLFLILYTGRILRHHLFDGISKSSFQSFVANFTHLQFISCKIAALDELRILTLQSLRQPKFIINTSEHMIQ